MLYGAALAHVGTIFKTPSESEYLSHEGHHFLNKACLKNELLNLVTKSWSFEILIIFVEFLPKNAWPQ